MKQSAQRVTEKMPENENSKQPEIPNADVPSGADSAVSAKPALPIDLSTIDPAKIRMAENFGIPIGQILSWMQSVEARFNELAQLNPAIQRIDTALSEAAQKTRVAEPQPMPQQQAPFMSPNSMASLIPMFAEALKGGAGESNIMQDLAMESLKADIDLSRTLKSSIMANIISRESRKVTDAVTE